LFDKSGIQSILVIKLRNIGDVLLTSPVFANLRICYPQARICALVNSGTDAMLTDNPDIDHVYAYQRAIKKAPFIQRITNELRFLAKIRRERFDLVINMTEGDRGAIVALTSGAAFKVGVTAYGRGFRGKDRVFDMLLDPLPEEFHTVDQNLAFLNALDIPVVHKRVSFHFDEQTRNAVRTRLQQAGLVPGEYFHAHVTSRWMFKTPSPATMAAILDRLTELTGLPGVVETAPVPKEIEYLERVIAACCHTPVNLGDVPLKQLGALSGMARFFVGVDSAPMHIAAAMDVPVLALFGPLPARTWGPWDNSRMNSPYGEPRGIQTTGKHMVIQSSMPCVPCHRDGCNGSKKSDCLDFSQEMIMSVCDKFLLLLHPAPHE
jgi:heptosyltransferase-3